MQVLVGCVMGALAAKGLVPMWVATVVIGRDVGQVAVMALLRWRLLGWRVKGLTAAQFFQTQPGQGTPGMPYVQPLMISKVNTVLQLALVSACMSSATLGVPDAQLVSGLEVLTAATTVGSLAAYMWVYAQGRANLSTGVPPSK